MSARFANSTFFPFQMVPVTAAMDAAGEIEAGSPNERHTLGDLARLKVVKGEARATVELSAPATTGQATVSLKHGATTLYSETITLNTAQRFDLKGEVDLYGVGAAEQLAWFINVTTGADIGITAKFAGGLKIEHPLIIGF